MKQAWDMKQERNVKEAINFKQDWGIKQEKTLYK